MSTTAKAKKATAPYDPDNWLALDALQEYAQDSAEKAHGHLLGAKVASDLATAAEAVEHGKPLSVKILRADCDLLYDEAEFAAGFGIAVLLHLLLDKIEAES
jgi:hypothetical protein